MPCALIFVICANWLLNQGVNTVELVKATGVDALP
jgi:hypothetical protein